MGDNEELERDIASLTDFIMTQSNTKSLKFHSRRGADLDGDFWACSKFGSGRHELHFDIEGIVNPEKALSKFALIIKKLEKEKRKIMEKVTRNGKRDALSDKNIDALGAIEENLVQYKTFEKLLHSY